MRKAFMLLMLVAHLANAQSWCPPGAKWTYEYANILGGYYGVQRVEYVSDTLLGGYTAQRLDQTDVVAPWGTTDYTTYPSFSLYTRYDNEVVFIWDNVSAFDTMFWFGAVPGDHWNAPGWPDGGNIKVTVLDTATEVIGGVPLRRTIVEPIPGWPIDTVYERIGALQLNINGFSWFVLDMPYDGLRCYSDQDIDYAAPGVSDCGFTSSVPDAVNERDNGPFPNPGTDHFTIELPSHDQQATVILLDATGREVWREVLRKEANNVHTSSLKLGLYNYRICAKDGGLLGHGRWIKE